MIKKRNKIYLFFGILLILGVLFTTNIFASQLDNVNISFEKEYYSVIEDNPLTVVYTLENNNSEVVNLLVYASCDNDELSCNYSKTFNLVGNSNLKTSLVVRALDDDTTDLKLYIKDMNNNEEKSYTIRIYAEDGLDDGDFEVDIQKTSFCKGESITNYIMIDDVLYSGLYNLSLTSQTLSVALKESNPIYLNRNENNIPFMISIPKDQSEGNYNLKLKIYNEDVTVVKNFSVYVNDCAEVVNSDLFVSGPTTISYIMYKGEPITFTFTLRNTSLNKTKDFFISYDKDTQLSVSLSQKQIRLLPGEIKKIDVTVLAPITIPADDYDLNLSFFDELGVINKKYIFKVQPDYYFKANLQESNLILNIGQITQTKLFLENIGDIKDTINISYILSNDLRVTTSSTKITLDSKEGKAISFNIFSGANTTPRTSVISFILKGTNSDFYKKIDLTVVALKESNKLKISMLSFPTELNVYKNSTKKFSFEIKNDGLNKINISKIELTFDKDYNLTYTFPQNISLDSKESKAINGSINVSDLPNQKIESEIVIYESSGVFSKPLVINIVDEKDTSKKKSIIGGFFSLGNSILFGIIFLALLFILLYSTRVIKHKQYNRL
ncbi:MAG: hypothetical protein WCY27_01545 [archaeon]|nr:hypothetical protein [archaeon]MDD2477855.1 hypothetical protein [Candidatus ainarchaeum sp.]MDD3084590.1 hypothetical protein [Candidatus ainarchaeum sp.]MDD4221121.1 hypothetical protein [Candidatus ainarchaeum sp.]MDD4662608.1 hypothetical protein [Candidatus ainarchaeum sp.]